MSEPLRYSISKLSQLPECLSNSSKHTRLHIRTIHDEPKLSGFQVLVEDRRYGTLFAYMVNASGDLIYPEEYHTMTIAEMLKHLENFGFLIEYNQEANLPFGQIEYLKTLQALRFDKIRPLPVKHSDRVKVHLVVFNIESNPKWLSWPYVAPDKEFIKAVANGSALVLDDISESKQFRWDWLTYVGDIGDIIRDNTSDES